MPTNWLSEGWEGGRSYRTSHGNTVYVIRKQVQGKRYEIPLAVETRKQALTQLALFERDRDAYQTPARQKEDQRRAKEQREREEELEAVRLDDESVARYLAAIGDRSHRYRFDTRRYLAAWAGKLGGRDLRRVEPRETLRLLQGWPSAKQKRIAAIKAFCSWLVKTGQLDPAQDPSRTLTVPPSKPERALREKGYEMSFVEALYGGVDEQPVRDVLCLHAKLGMHDSEVRRIAAGECRLERVSHPVIKGTIKFVHKSGRVHTVSCDGQTFAAAQRLQERKNAPSPDKVRWVLGAAAVTLKLLPMPASGSNGRRPPSVNLGELRHSFVSWSLAHGEVITIGGKGVPLEMITSVLGHTNTTTTKRFYDVSRVPAMVKLPLRLQHPGDPALTAARHQRAT